MIDSIKRSWLRSSITVSCPCPALAVPPCTISGLAADLIWQLRYSSCSPTFRDKTMAAWVEGRVAGKRQWTDALYSLQVSAPEVTFTAGQFARLALPAPPQ